MVWRSHPFCQHIRPTFLHLVLSLLLLLLLLLHKSGRFYNICCAWFGFFTKKILYWDTIHPLYSITDALHFGKLWNLHWNLITDVWPTEKQKKTMYNYHLSRNIIITELQSVSLNCLLRRRCFIEKLISHYYAQHINGSLIIWHYKSSTRRWLKNVCTFRLDSHTWFKRLWIQIEIKEKHSQV